MVQRDPVLSTLATLIVVACTFAFDAVLGAASPEWAHYYYFKEQRPLQLDASQLAILDPGSVSTSRVDRFLRAAGYEEPALAPRQMRGWSLFSLPNASGTPEMAPNGGASPGEMITSTISRLLELDRDEQFLFSPVFAGRFGSIIPTRKVLVKFDENLGEVEIADVLAEQGAGAMKRFPLGGMMNAFAIEVASRSGIEVLALANRLAVQPEVLTAESNMMFSGRSGHIPNDPSFSESWGHHNTGQLDGTPDMDVDVPEAWERTKGGDFVTTIIIDTGVEQLHPDLHQLFGFDVTDDAGDGGPMNACDNHGTPVAGIVASTIDNNLGTAGVAPEAWIRSIRTFQSVVSTGCNSTPGWETETQWTIDALVFAESLNARVTNNSNFYDFQSPSIAQKYQETRDEGMLHFASAGNDAVQHVEYPASLPSVHAVTAISRTGNQASFSSWGAEVTFTAPGDDLFTTDRTGSDGWTSGDYAPDVWGTSFSSPMIAGVAALLVSEASSLDADEVDALLRSSALDLGAPGWDQIYGWGLPKAAAALEALDRFADSFESGDTSQWSFSSP